MNVQSVCGFTGICLYIIGNDMLTDCIYIVQQVY